MSTNVQKSKSYALAALMGFLGALAGAIVAAVPVFAYVALIYNMNIFAHLVVLMTLLCLVVLFSEASGAFVASRWWYARHAEVMTPADRWAYSFVSLFIPVGFVGLKDFFSSVGYAIGLVVGYGAVLLLRRALLANWCQNLVIKHTKLPDAD